MAQANKTTEESSDRRRETAEARARLMHMAKQQGVGPLSFEEMLGDPAGADPEKEDVDELLSMLREWRAEPDSGDSISGHRR
jgi:hypothetical protein